MRQWKDAITSTAALWHTAFRLGLYKLHGVLHETVTIQTRQGRLTMSARDDGIAKILFCKRELEYGSSLRAVRFLKTVGLVPEENLCLLDVGANLGVITIGLLLDNEIQSAIAVEPEPVNFALLIKNVEQNRLTALSRD